MVDRTTRILVVDDTLTIRIIVRKQLEALGLSDIVDATDGDVALQLLLSAEEAGKPFGLVICDWAMPRLSGYDLLRVIRTTPSIQDLPFLMLSSTAEADRIVMAIKAGVSGYVVKPIDAIGFRDKVETILTDPKGKTPRS